MKTVKGVENARNAKLSDLDKVFGENGLVAAHHDNYEYRVGQVNMAEAALRAFEDKKHLIVEAGTGTGKTLAYLVPAIAAALSDRKRIVISTGTKNLQSQLMEKDIPFLKKIMPKKFSVACMKGRSNYACLFRIKKAKNQPILEGLDELNYFEKIRYWSHNSKTGDKDELTNLPENIPFWSRINAKSDTCLGQNCEDFEACFITRMRQKAEDADIVIVNHHLFFADLNIRGNEYGKVIPNYGAVIFDEAHLIEDIAADYFGFRVSNFQIEEIIRDANNLPITDAIYHRDITKSAAKISEFADQFWARFGAGRGREGRFPLIPNSSAKEIAFDEIQNTPLGEAYVVLDNALGGLLSAIGVFVEEITEAESLARRIERIRSDLKFIISRERRDFVYWLERRGRGVFLCASPIDVSELLREKLFDKVETCILTSATLSSDGKFDFIRKRLGLDENKTETLLAPSSFNYEKQAVVYLPKSISDPRSSEFIKSCAVEIEKLLKITSGRAFVLSTSVYAMNALYKIVSSRVDFPCFVQGSTSKAGLLEKFMNRPKAVLFATSSFWQGVDVRGERLSCVIIDKLPFAVPSDPVVAARNSYIEENGGNSFFDYSVPNAIILLKQGVGRLIRSASDTGVIALLDSRLRTKAYGKRFLSSLPKTRITNELRDVEKMFI